MTTQPTEENACTTAGGTWTPDTTDCIVDANKVTISRTSVSDFFLVDGAYAKAYPKK